MVVDRGDHGAKRIENFAAVEIEIFRLGGSERDRCESRSERRDKHYGERLYAAPLKPRYATNVDGQSSLRVTTASIRLMTSLIDLVSAGEITSKQQSHFGQRQR
jgi:hypothetical protein